MLTDDDYGELDARLAPVDAELRHRYPGERFARQPVHTVYVPADRFRERLAASYGRVNSTWSLPLLVGMPKAKELLYTGREVTAAEAERIGLLNQVVPAAQLRATAVQMAEMIAQNDTRMVQGIKRLLHEDIGMHWRERYDNEEEARATWLTSAHQREGFKDFLSRKGQRA